MGGFIYGEDVAIAVSIIPVLHCDYRPIVRYRNGASKPSALPLVCPQDNVQDSAMSEDCLSMILYVPKGVKVGTSVPILLWYVKIKTFVATVL